MKRYLLLMLPLALAACTPPAPEASTPATDAAVAAPAAALDVATLSGHYWQLAEAKARLPEEEAVGEVIDAPAPTRMRSKER